jgi:hypothetical protein
MMIVIVHNAETGQAQMLGENMTDPELTVKLLRGFADGIEQQQAQAQAAQNNGHQRRPSGLIIPPTIVPRDAIDPNAPKQ